MKRIALIADFNPTSETHAATVSAIRHSADALGLSVDSEWVATDELSPEIFQKVDGVWFGTGSPYKNLEGVLQAIEFARQHDVPTLGTCSGFQHMILEFARNELKFSAAAHAEYDSTAQQRFIVPLPCSLRGRSLQIRLVPDSKVAKLYGSIEVTEEYFCSFGVNPAYTKLFCTSSIRIVGSDSEGELRVIENPKHRFFVGTLFVPQTRSRPGDPHPVVTGFVRAVVEKPKILSS